MTRPARSKGPGRRYEGMGKAFEGFAREVKRDLVPLVENSRVFVCIAPVNQIDIKSAVEMGIALMLGKPMVLVIPPDTFAPDKLRAVADEIIVVESPEEDVSEKVAIAVMRLVEENLR